MNAQLIRIGMVWCALIPAVAFANEGSQQESTNSEVGDPELEFMMRHALSYTGTRTADGAKITPLLNPLLRWTNPLVGIEEGVYVAWTDPSGRPMSVAQIYFFPPSRKWFIEHQSLCDGPMVFQSELGGDWTPEKPGISWTKFGNGVAKPAESKTRRMIEMRDLARRFRVDGTDPEITIQIEARQDMKSLQRHYYWALSPMTTYELTAYLEDTEVWHAASSRPTGERDIFHPHELATEAE